MFYKTAVWWDISKIVNLFYKIGLWFQYSLLNKKVSKFIENEIRFHRCFSRALLKSSILQLYRTTIFLAQLLMVASDHLLSKCNQKIRQVKNRMTTHHIAEEKLKKLGFWNWCLIFSNGCIDVIGELQLPNALQYCFKIFSGSNRINDDENDICLFSNYL